MRKLIARTVAGIPWLAVFACVPGGALWALSPLGISLAGYYLAEGADGFWRMFFPAPLLMLAGLVGIWWLGRVGSGWLARVGFAGMLAGLVAVISGNVGQFWLGLDDTFMVTAPAYRAFRAGLVLLAVGCIVFGAASARNRSLPLWGALPFVAAAICGLVAFVGELGNLGSGLWTAFGAGWMWLGLSVLLARLSTYLRERKVGKSTK